MRSIEPCALLCLLLVACQPYAPPPAPLAAAPPAGCARPLPRLEELAGILKEPLLAAQPVPGDPQSCRYSTRGFPALSVSARAGVGRATLDAWRQGRVPLAATPVAAGGQAALWQEGLHELMAEQDDLLCDVQVGGDPADFALPPEALTARLGEVCRNLFTTR